MTGQVWERQRLRFICNVNPIRGKKDSLPPDTEASFVPMENIGEQGSLSLEKTKLIEEVSSGYTYFEDGDVVFAKITPCFENGKGTLAEKLVNGIAFGTTELHVLRPLAASNGKFLYYLTCSDAFRKDGESWMYGAGGQKRVPEDYVKDYSLPFPLLTIQKAIAAYLDKETTRIDALIAKKERQIELLEEKRQAIITRAITKGLDSKAKMKDSGVDWIGEIPEGWQVKKLRYLGTCQNGISKGGDSFGSGFPFVSYGDAYKNYELPQTVEGLVESTEQERNAYSVQVGDVLFTRTSETIEEIGFASTCMKTIHGATFAGFLIRFRPQKNVFNMGFAKYYFRASLLRRFFVKEMSIVTRASLSQDLLKSLPVLLPPYEEMKRIADYLDSITARIDDLNGKLDHSIRLLTEYRSSLITAATSGQIDIPLGQKQSLGGGGA